MAKGISLRNLLLIALMALAVPAVILIAPPPEMRVKPRASHEMPDNWFVLCEKTDCSQFPKGYLTTKVGDGYFHFPRFAGAKIERGRNRYFDVADDGLVSRWVDLNPKRGIRVGVFCCPNLHMGYGVPPPMKSGYHKAESAYYYAPGYPPKWKGLTPGSAEVLLAKEDLRAFRSAEDLARRGLPSFDENFWIVRDGGTVHGSSKPRVLLISKRPMLFGRHVWMDCGNKCYAATVYFTNDPQPDLPHVFVTKLSDETLDGGRTCHKRGPCEPSKTRYDVLPETLQWIERVILAMQRRPGDVAGA